MSSFLARVAVTAVVFSCFQSLVCAHSHEHVSRQQPHRRMKDRRAESSFNPEYQASNIFYSSEVSLPAAVHDYQAGVGNRVKDLLKTAEEKAGKNYKTVPGSDDSLKKEPMRGVSAGGWFVLESWMSPSLFETANSLLTNQSQKITDEWTFTEYLGREKATELLEKHWDTWLIEDDFKTMADYGLNYVRINFGYWMFDISAGEPYVQGQLDYLKRGIEWCKKYGLKVQLDLHGAPGSQNGYDNSGRKGDIDWPTLTSNLNRTTQVLHQVAQEFSQPQYSGTVTGIELLNEPAASADDKVKDVLAQFYLDSYEAIRFASNVTVDGIEIKVPNNLEFVIHDGSLGLTYWDGFMSQDKGYSNVVLDTHIYTVFSKKQLNWTTPERITHYCSLASKLSTSNQNLPTIVGEWNEATTDCASMSSQFGNPSSYNVTVGSCDGLTTALGGSLSDDFKADLRRLFEVQTTLYETQAGGWIYWSWKLEKGQEWSYSSGVEGGWIPKDPTEKIYGDQCANSTAT